MTESALEHVRTDELDAWLSALSQTLRAEGLSRLEQAARLEHCLHGAMAAVNGEAFPPYEPDASMAAMESSPDAFDELIRCGEEMETALRGVLDEKARQTDARKADDVFDSLFSVAGYVSLMHEQDPDTWMAEGIREAVREEPSPALKVAGALLAAHISPPLIGWTNALTKMLGDAVAAGRRHSVERALGRAVRQTGHVLGRQARTHRSVRRVVVRATPDPDAPSLAHRDEHHTDKAPRPSTPTHRAGGIRDTRAF